MKGEARLGSVRTEAGSCRKYVTPRLIEALVAEVQA